MDVFAHITASTGGDNVGFSMVPPFRKRDNMVLCESTGTGTAIGAFILVLNQKGIPICQGEVIDSTAYNPGAAIKCVDIKLFLMLVVVFALPGVELFSVTVSIPSHFTKLSCMCLPRWLAKLFARIPTGHHNPLIPTSSGTSRGWRMSKTRDSNFKINAAYLALADGAWNTWWSHISIVPHAPATWTRLSGY